MFLNLFFPSKSNMARQEAGYEFSGGDGSEGGAESELGWLVAFSGSSPFSHGSESQNVVGLSMGK